MPATDDYLRDLKSMHKVFCVSAVVLLAVTLWMMWADYNDEWRTFQRKAFAYQAERDRSARSQDQERSCISRRTSRNSKQKVDAAKKATSASRIRTEIDERESIAKAAKDQSRQSSA